MLYKILSFDPGMHTFGYCISTYDEHDFIIKDAGTYDLEMLYKEFDKCKRYYPIVYTKNAILRKLLLKLIRESKPDYIASEAAFYNPSRPAAYASLLRFIYTLEDTVYTILKKNTYKMAPLMIKKVSHSKVKGKATKDDMKVALQENINNEIIQTKLDISKLDEHAIDASLIGYAFTQLWLPLITAKLIHPSIVTFTVKMDKSIDKLYKKMLSDKKSCKLK